MRWYRHEVYKSDIYSDCGQYRITGRRIAGNDFAYQAYQFSATTSNDGYTVEGWRPLGKPTDLEGAKRICEKQH